MSSKQACMLTLKLRLKTHKKLEKDKHTHTHTRQMHRELGMGKGQQNSSNMIGGIRRSAGGGMMMMMRSSSRYGFMIMVGFGAAVFGVMVLHTLRERRIFDLLLKDKDQQLFSIQLLLQKERDYAKAAKRKADEMKAKIYYLRTQNLNLNNRILEMGSTISSMKDGSRAVEMALAQKEKEIKQLRERENEYDNKVTPLTEMLRQKEAEIKSMKQRIEQPVKVWSVSTDDPSNPPQVNLTEPAIMANTDGGGSESANNSIGENSRKGEDGRKIEEEVADEMEKAGEEQPRKLEDSLEESLGNGTTTSGTHGDPRYRDNLERSQVEGISGIGNEEHYVSTAWEKNTSVEVQNHLDEDSNRESHLEVHARSVKSENDESGVKYRGLVKLEMDTNKRKAEGRRSRIKTKHRMSGNKGNGVTRMGLGGRTFFKGSLENERNKTQQNGDIRHADDNKGLNIADELQETDKQAALEHKNEKASLEGENVKNRQLDAKITGASTGVNLLKNEDSVIARNSRDKGGDTKSNQPGERVQEMDITYINSERHRVEELRSNRTVGGEDNGTNSGAETDNQYKQLDEETGDSHKDIDHKDVDQEDNISKQGKATDKDEEPENLEIEDVQESDTDISRESSSTLEEDKEEYEETNEPEF